MPLRPPPFDRHHWHRTISATIGAQLIAHRVHVVETVASTQDEAASVAARKEPGWLVTTHVQTHGRGRRGVRWSQHNEHAGLGIALSLTLPMLDHARSAPTLARDSAPGVVASAGLAIIHAVEMVAPQLNGVLGIKWPNDVVQNQTGQKLAGCLVEQIGRVLVLGVGINIYQQPIDFDLKLRGRATSLCQLLHDESTHEERDLRLDLVCAWVQAFDSVMRLEIDPLKTEYLAHDAIRGRVCTVRSGIASTPIEGTVETTDPWNGIEMADESGKPRYNIAAATARVLRVRGWCDLDTEI